ncbi:MAG: RagB/SusD family nutrient uptake outer membrane protein [Muribaculaceae bacterium]|nr:RagB/SusD family nutrient uptake outer membrane protein [Muribaculaceae bacterium]
MDTIQRGVLDDTEQLDFDYITNLRNFSVYSALRGRTVGSWVYNTELQLDQFIGMANNGGRGGNISNGYLTSSSSEFSGAYASLYSNIANVNFLIEQCESMLASGSLNADETVEVERYLGEAHFTRGWDYFWLLDHFTNTNEAATNAENALGLQLVSVYAPTGESSKYPGRSSLKASIDFINEDLDYALNALTNYETNVSDAFCTAGANYLSSYAVQALQARMALVIGDYETAVTKAQAVIDNSNYSLAAGDAYLDMWYDANVDELIFAPFVDKNEISDQQAFSTCQGWNYWWVDPSQCDYIPTEASVYSLAEFEDAEGYLNDIRFYAFLGGQPSPILTESGTTQTYVFWKYPGNEDLDKTTTMYDNTPKPFRLSEQYLILAEAAALIGDTKTTIAQDAISDLVKARLYDDSDFTQINLTGTALLNFIRNERSKELMGEGFRLSDLRRWKQGFNRADEEYTINPVVAANRSINALQVKYADDDYRFVWAIPQSEMNVNPQLAGQQNPGY